ncbi:hypothetical protein AZH51_14120 [Branchiibius sp. NY16-3462-2]|nr:hypothetical protein AZH51_14120 [Branchiibius sp. NY16-3462-2]
MHRLGAAIDFVLTVLVDQSESAAMMLHAHPGRHLVDQRPVFPAARGEDVFVDHLQTVVVDNTLTGVDLVDIAWIGWARGGTDLVGHRGAFFPRRRVAPYGNQEGWRPR